MRKVKIVHTGDIHFDSPFSEVNLKQSKINKEELKEVFVKILDFSLENQIDILLIAGDVFDNLTISKETAYFIETSLKRISNIRVFISPGNHDPYGSKSFYKLIKWPDNVHIFKDNIEKIYIDELDTNIWGIGFTDKYVRKSLLDNFQIDINDSSINIMVIHGEISNNSQTNEYNPVTIDQIKKSNLDYLALGHKHKFEGIKKVANTNYAYCGCPQGRGFDELGDKGIIYGEVSKGVVDLDYIKINKRNYEQINIDISNLFGYEEIVNKILNAINSKNRENNFYKIVLIGEVSSEFIIDESIIESKIKNFFYYVKIIDKTTSIYDVNQMSKGYSVKAVFVRKMIDKLENETDEATKEIIKLALKKGIEALTDNEVNKDVYKRDNN